VPRCNPDINLFAALLFCALLLSSAFRFLRTHSLKEDFGLAFKRLTELGFQASADEAPAYYTPREWHLES
jgi:hypothetical protein